MFEDVWNVKLPWVEFMANEQGKVHLMRCKACSKIDGKDKMLAPKIDSLWKHARRRKALVGVPKVCDR